MEHAGIPKLPQITLLILLNFKIWNNKAAVVDFPFVPVMPIILALGQISTNRSISLIILTLLSIASFIALCFSLLFIGIPGLTTNVFILSHGQ